MISKKLKLPINEFPKNNEVIYRGDLFSARRVPNNLSHNRLGVVFKSGAFKTASLRNRLRRAVFDALSAFVLSKPADHGIDLLISLNPPIISLTRKEITAKINVLDPIQRIIASPARQPTRFPL